MSTSAARRLAALAAVVVGSLSTALPALGADFFTPNPVNVTLAAGQSTTIDKRLHLDALPGAADIVIAIDTTGSMGPAIAQAKAEAATMVTDIQNQIPGARFAIVDFKDYPFSPFGSSGDWPYLDRTGGFTSSQAAVVAAINAMSAGGGNDFPESYNRVFYEALNDPALSYNATAVRFLVVLGDSIGHDPNQQATFPACPNTSPLDPGRDATLGTADDLPTQPQLAALAAANDTLLMIHYTDPSTFASLSCYQQVAGYTGGSAVEGGSGASLSSQIIAAIQAKAAAINSVNLVVSPAGCPLGIAFNPVPPYGPFTAPVDILFQETITAPTIPGAYSCAVTAIVDGTERAIQHINATVTPGPPATLTLTPPDATNTAGQTHCVTALVRDEFGNPVPGVPVHFDVTGANTASGDAVTGPDGAATFCYVGTHAGTDTIVATAEGGSHPSATASKTWKPGRPAHVTLTPATATNVVDSQHCVIATVTDAFGNLVPGATVLFDVSGSVTTTGSVPTDASGQAKFCYTGPALPGSDVITATVDVNGNGKPDADEPSATVEKRWVLPESMPGCKVTYGGRITAANGDMATFGGNAFGTGPSGQEEYQDHGPAADLNVHSITILAVTCSSDGTSASIFGTATINGGGSVMFRIDVQDLGEPGTSDTYRIRFAGYDSGVQTLNHGNIQIH